MKSGLILASLGLLLLPAKASATFSIIACDETRACGAAVATNNLAVGASVIYAQAGVGAIATQFETNPSYGPKGLALLAQGQAADATLKALLDGDGNFEGQDIGYRQVGVVRLNAPGVAYTGTEALASGWSGTLTGQGYSVQGNGLAGEAVLTAIRDSFLKTKGPLAERLLAAIQAGEAAGGQANGRLSAALLVRTIEGGWQDVDFRVDAAAAPITELERLLGMRRANDAMIDAERAWRKGNKEETVRYMTKAALLGPGWDRIWRRITRLSLTMGDTDRACRAFTTFATLNPVWAGIERKDPFYAPLAGSASGKCEAAAASRRGRP